MTGDRPRPRDATPEIAAAYRRFADEEARGRSPLYAELARGVADDPEVIAFLRTLPPDKRQPNLLLAASRHLFGTADGWAAFRRTLLDQPAAVAALMRRRSTQTNEPGRCATLLPVLARLPQPLALIEVGASAGLCLLPDFYAYHYDGYDCPGRRIAAADRDAPVLRCRADPATPLPDGPPQVVWRAGLDLNPLDATDAGDVSWLETLVWPGQAERLERLQRALAVAARHRPRVVRGDLRRDLAALAAEAPPDATLVVFHTAVLSYVASTADRDAFATAVAALGARWVANESPRVLPAIAARAGAPPATGCFLLSVDGRPCAWTDPHGTAIEWIGDEPANHESYLHSHGGRTNS